MNYLRTKEEKSVAWAVAQHRFFLDLLVIFEERIIQEYYQQYNMKLPKKIKAPKPSKEQKEFYKSLDLELMSQVIKAKKGHRYMEAYILEWSVVEQFLLPKLMLYIGDSLNIKLPGKLEEMHASQLIKLYLFLSHDKELYDSLEVARKTRNKLIHGVTKHTNWNEMKKGFRSGFKDEVIPLLVLFQDRFSGKTPIPVLTLYRNGWNDASDKFKKKIDSLIKENK